MADLFLKDNGNGRPPPDPPHVANMSVTTKERDSAERMNQNDEKTQSGASNDNSGTQHVNDNEQLPTQRT